MTRKHYEAVAAVIRDEVDSVSDLPTVQAVIVRISLLNVADGLADVFAADNPRFDRERFLAACGLGE